MKPMGTSVGLGMEMDAGKLKRELRENVDLLVTVAGAAGFGSVVAFAADAREMLCEHPASSLLLAAGCLLAGYAAARAIDKWSGWGRRRRVYRRLSEAVPYLPRRSKRFIAKAMDEGRVVTTPFDQDVQNLLHIGVFYAPPVSSLTATSYSVNPLAFRAIAEHRAEWLGR